MTEDEWLKSPHPIPMLEFLEGNGSDRKLRLYAIACCRHQEVWSRLKGASKAVIEAAEYAAENGVGWERVIDIAHSAPQGTTIGGTWVSTPVRLPLSSQAERAVLALKGDDVWEAAWNTTREALNLLRSSASDLLRDIFGNPFRTLPVIQPECVRWNEGAVIQLARDIYQDQMFDRFALVADELESAGCEDIEVLQHFRSGGPHVRGCWALDSVLGKS